MGQGLPKNHKKYRTNFCSANNCIKCLIVEINFLLQKCRLHSVYGLSVWIFNQGFLLYDFQKELFFTFLRHQRGISKEDFNHWFLSENLTIAKINIFGRQDLRSPILTFMNFFVEIYTLFSAAFYCPFFLIHEKITGYLFWAKSSLP